MSNSLPLPSPDRFVVDEQGNKETVIIPLQQYEQLLEDLHDLAVVAERRSEETISPGRCHGTTEEG